MDAIHESQHAEEVLDNNLTPNDYVLVESLGFALIDFAIMHCEVLDPTRRVDYLESLRKYRVEQLEAARAYHAFYGTNEIL